MKTQTIINSDKNSIYKHKLIVLIICIFCIFLSDKAFAQMQETGSRTDVASSDKNFKHALNFCPVAIAFGIYAINYEYLFKPSHGIVARFEYESIPKSYTEASIESSGVAFSLNYRWHISGEMKSPFIGAYTRYRTYDGAGTLESTVFDFTKSEFALGLNAGKRWVWNSGFNVTISLGYGFSFDDRVANPTNMNIESVLNKFEDDYDFSGPLFGELSIGYAF